MEHTVNEFKNLLAQVDFSGVRIQLDKFEKDMIRIHTSWENELNTITWLSEQLGRPYDKVGALLSPFSWRRRNIAYDHYFCSQLMACALQRLHMIPHCNPGNLTPNSLFRVLQGA